MVLLEMVLSVKAEYTYCHRETSSVHSDNISEQGGKQEASILLVLEQHYNYFSIAITTAH